MQQQVDNQVIYNHGIERNRFVYRDYNNDPCLEERIKKLEETKFIDIMGQMTYFFRINTNFDLFTSISIVSLGIYMFFFIDYFINRNSKY